MSELAVLEYNMPYIPTTKLDRLDVPAKGGLWKLWQRLFRSCEERRETFMRLMIDHRFDERERNARLRTLIDIGLWGDHPTEKDLIEEHEAGKTFKGAIRQHFFDLISDSSFTIKDESKFNEERRSLGFHVLVAYNNGTCSKELVHLAFEAGVDPDWREQNNYDDTLLTLFTRNMREDLFDIALKAGSDPQLTDSCNDTAMCILIERMNRQSPSHKKTIQMAEKILEAGFNINSPGKPKKYSSGKGRTPLAKAIETPNGKGLKWLLTKNVDLDCRDLEGNGISHLLIYDSPKTIQNIENILNIKIDPNLKNIRGETPLIQAISLGNGREELLDFLMDRGADPAIRATHQKQDYTSKTVEVPGKTTLQLLIENYKQNGWSRDFLSRIEAKHPECWSWPFVSGEFEEEEDVDGPVIEEVKNKEYLNLASWVAEADQHPVNTWRSAAECHTLMKNTASINPTQQPGKKALRL